MLQGDDHVVVTGDLVVLIAHGLGIEKPYAKVVTQFTTESGSCNDVVLYGIPGCILCDPNSPGEKRIGVSGIPEICKEVTVLDKELSSLGQVDLEAGEVGHLLVDLYLGEVGIYREVEVKAVPDRKTGIASELEVRKIVIGFQVLPGEAIDVRYERDGTLGIAQWPVKDHIAHVGQVKNELVLGNVYPGIPLVILGVELVTVESPTCLSLPKLEGRQRDDPFADVVSLVFYSFGEPFGVPTGGETPKFGTTTRYQGLPLYALGIGPEKERIVPVVKGIEHQGDVITTTRPEIPS